MADRSPDGAREHLLARWKDLNRPLPDLLIELKSWATRKLEEKSLESSDERLVQAYVKWQEFDDPQSKP